ncbi:MAG: CotH kinase family protein [Lachnospiraceae bacterium]|nr:CotH kinase family protein [Lachnospiraceae bacterium]
MVDSKHISKIIIALMLVAVSLCLMAFAFSDQMTELLGGKGIGMEYETELFDADEVISVDIQMDQDDWETMLSNVMSEEYYVCDVVVNGLKVFNVGIRPKGNTSLSSIAMDPDSDRYSLKLEFDHFVEEQTCYGLDKLILNNNYADATNMKEAIVYDMYQYLGADASLYNYAEVSVNGEYVGIYLALEGVEDSFMLRNYGSQDGELYKPESFGMGGGNSSQKQSGSSSNSKGSNMPGFGGDFDPGNMPDMNGGDFDPGSMPDMNGGDFNPGDMPDMNGEDFNPGDMPDMRGDRNSASENKSASVEGDMNGGFSMSNGGANLNYTDDDLDSYSTIWEGAVTDTTEKDRRRVVTALENISNGTDLEKYMDVDNILKYMAVHTFVVNMDSLSGSMAHNYYLYEYDGQLNIIPWDYNLAFGGMSMGGGSADDMVNDAIDTPFSCTDFFDALLENEEYLERYHEYLDQLVEEYVGGGRFDETYQRIRSQIDDLVATDPTAFYSAEEYDTAAEMLYDTVKLRAMSISGQLNGTIPATDQGQREDSSALIDASAIDIAAMGQFNAGGSAGSGSRAASGGSSEKGLNIASSDPDSGKASFPAGFGAGVGGASFPGSFGSGNDTGNSIQGLITLAVCLLVMVILLLGIKKFKHRY